MVTDIPSLVASIDVRLDQLAAQISALEDARAALQAQPVIATPVAPAAAAAAGPARPGRRATLRTTSPATEAAGPPRAGAAQEQRAESAKGAKTPATTEITAPARRGAGRAMRGRRSGALLSADGLQLLLGDALSGLSAGAIAEHAGAGYSRVLALLRELESAGTVRRTGSRRSTRWLLVSDEDRIAQCVAELERLVGARREDRTQRRGRARAS
jgi:hypothetical protein